MIKRRSYRSPRRRGQAEETRRRILAAARELFMERGYGATTIEAIAETAGVAPQTVYAGLASKRGIVFALLDDMALEADRSQLYNELAEAKDDPRRQLRAVIAFTDRFYARGIDLINIARSVSGAEPDLAAMWTEGEGRRHKALSDIVVGWARAGMLVPGVTAEEATDLVWAFIGPDMFRLLVVERSWSRRRFRSRIAAVIERQLFGELGGSPDQPGK